MQDAPLAEILRPQSLDDVIGQQHLVGADGVLRKLIASGILPSMIFWGPPGCGKTTLAKLLANQVNAYFESKSAVTATLADVRMVIKEAKERKLQGVRTILFLDEIHRFSKSQQDALLPGVEDGTIIFIGATTENPSFEVISPLLSRCRVLVLKPHGADELSLIIERGLEHVKKTITPEAKNTLVEFANGDGRALLTILEIAASLSKKKEITTGDIEQAAQKKLLQYDQGGEEHYNTISAFIKSMRAGDTDASVYYVARMIAAGEDPLFIARRMVIFASEDIGLAQPTAQVVANGVFDACHKVGYPEAGISLAFGAVYLAQAKKDRRAYDALQMALADVQKYGNLPIPLNIRNAPTKLMKDLGYGKGYEMYGGESLLPEKLKGKKYVG